MNNIPLIKKIGWMYSSIKEEYKYINSLINQLSKVNVISSINIENGIAFYKKSLLLFKKSLEQFSFCFERNIFTLNHIELIKEVYLRRCLINIDTSYRLLNDPLSSNAFSFKIYKEIVIKIFSLISLIKDLGNSLELIKKYI